METLTAERRNVETSPAADGTTVYVMPAATLGDTIERALAAHADARHVVVCGDRPGAGKSGALAWAAERGRWYLTGEPHVTRSAFRASLAADGVRVRVTRIEPWFGVGVTPADAAGAMRIIRHVAGRVGTRVAGTPANVGRQMLACHWSSSSRAWPTVPPAIADLLRSTSGQGRFQLMAAAADGGAELVAVDARFQYGALAQLELPIGDPVEHDGASLDEYAPAWCEVEYAPTSSAPFGLLGVRGLGGWHWPTDGGPHRTWCSNAEIQLARQHGYRVTIRRAIEWPARGRPLAGWASLIDRERRKLDTLPLPDGVRAAARDGLRAIVVQTIGSLQNGASPVPFASANETGGAPFCHPEWTTALWALARRRLAAAMLDQAAPLVACALDGYYVAGEPVLDNDDGAAGRWREVWRGGAWPALRSMADLYALRDGTA